MKRAIVVAAAVLSACQQSDEAKTQTPKARVENIIKVGSSVAHMRIVATAKLPANPKPTPVQEYCSAYAIAKPKSVGGQLAARNGWIVTSETKLGSYDAVTFVGALEGSTSATCFHLNGNIAIFDGSKLKAIGYWKHSPEDPLTQGGDGIEDSLGLAQQIDVRRIRLYWGLPAPPFADVVLRDGIFIEPTAPKDLVCNGTAEVPNVFNEDIRTARKKLIASGWSPQQPPPADAMTGAEDLSQQGVTEGEACSGTGYGFCAFNYKSKKGMGLRVITGGEEYRVIGWTPYCSGAWQDRSRGSGYYSM